LQSFAPNNLPVANAAGSDVAHVPHVLITGSWEADVLVLDPAKVKHLTTVLKRSAGDHISYTDGVGRFGTGSLVRGGIVRGEERVHPRPHRPTIAVAPPANRERARFLVEKLAEVGTLDVWWLVTRFGQGRPPASPKVRSWCEAALEQSRSAWLMTVRPDPVPVDELPVGTVFADRAGTPTTSLPSAPCIAVGPEGGWAPDELPFEAVRVSLGEGVLRVETAALVAAVTANR
jgi:RsmE family RNA methyltransferase